MTALHRHPLVHLVVLAAVWPWPALATSAWRASRPESKSVDAVVAVHDAFPIALAPWPSERKPVPKGERLEGSAPAITVLRWQRPAMGGVRPAPRGWAATDWPGRVLDGAFLCRFLL